MLNINGLVKKYKDFTLNCSMNVERGRITGLIGENGAGKSTTFKSVLGLISCDSGDITLFGKKPQQLKKEEREKIGVVLGDAGFSGYLKVKDVVPVLAAMYPKFDRAAFMKLCAQLNIPQDKFIKEFSTGMKAKLKVIAAITHKADFLLMDEPTAGLDVMARERILDLLREYVEEDESRSILISSHISSDLESLCDDLYMIHNGKIILHEETDILLSNYGLLKADEEQFRKLDKSYLLRVKKEHYGYSCLTDQIRFYRENYPDMVIEKSGIDDVIMMTIKGEEI